MTNDQCMGKDETQDWSNSCNVLELKQQQIKLALEKSLLEMKIVTYEYRFSIPICELLKNIKGNE